MQLRHLRVRLSLIGIIYLYLTMAFVLVSIVMVAAYFEEHALSTMLLICLIWLLMVSMLVFKRVIQIANTALDVHLSDLEQDQGWQQYLKPKLRVRDKIG